MVHLSYTIVVLCLSFLSFAGQGGRKVSGQFLRKSVGQFVTFDPFGGLPNQTRLSKYSNVDAILIREKFIRFKMSYHIGVYAYN